MEVRGLSRDGDTLKMLSSLLAPRKREKAEERQILPSLLSSSSSSTFSPSAPSASTLPPPPPSPSSLSFSLSPFQTL